MWFQGGQHMVSKVDTMWFPQDTMWFPHGCHVVSIWTPSVVEVTMWKPVQKTALHEANWLPCYYLYYYFWKATATVKNLLDSKNPIVVNAMNNILQGLKDPK